uniref:TP53-binding protein 1-like isoform X2 n=1 Tax=Myxine glutinosa TaxID=7769 RepID=UPI00358FBD09
MDSGNGRSDALSQRESLCILVEDSQERSASEEIDQSYMASMAKHLSALEARAPSPILEPIMNNLQEDQGRRTLDCTKHLDDGLASTGVEPDKSEPDATLTSTDDNKNINCDNFNSVVQYAKSSTNTEGTLCEDTHTLLQAGSLSEGNHLQSSHPCSPHAEADNDVMVPCTQDEMLSKEKAKGGVDNPPQQHCPSSPDHVLPIPVQEMLSMDMYEDIIAPSPNACSSRVAATSSPIFHSQIMNIDNEEPMDVQEPVPHTLSGDFGPDAVETMETEPYPVASLDNAEQPVKSPEACALVRAVQSDSPTPTASCTLRTSCVAHSEPELSHDVFLPTPCEPEPIAAKEDVEHAKATQGPPLNLYLSPEESSHEQPSLRKDANSELLTGSQLSDGGTKGEVLLKQISEPVVLEQHHFSHSFQKDKMVAELENQSPKEVSLNLHLSSENSLASGIPNEEDEAAGEDHETQIEAVEAEERSYSPVRTEQSPKSEQESGCSESVGTGCKALSNSIRAEDSSRKAKEHDSFASDSSVIIVGEYSVTDPGVGRDLSKKGALSETKTSPEAQECLAEAQSAKVDAFSKAQEVYVEGEDEENNSNSRPIADGAAILQDMEEPMEAEVTEEEDVELCLFLSQSQPESFSQSLSTKDSNANIGRKKAVGGGTGVEGEITCDVTSGNLRRVQDISRENDGALTSGADAQKDLLAEASAKEERTAQRSLEENAPARISSTNESLDKVDFNNQNNSKLQPKLRTFKDTFVLQKVDNLTSNVVSVSHNVSSVERYQQHVPAQVDRTDPGCTKSLDSVQQKLVAEQPPSESETLNQLHSSSTSSSESALHFSLPKDTEGGHAPTASTPLPAPRHSTPIALSGSQPLSVVSVGGPSDDSHQSIGNEITASPEETSVPYVEPPVKMVSGSHEEVVNKVDNGMVKQAEEPASQNRQRSEARWSSASRGFLTTSSKVRSEISAEDKQNLHQEEEEEEPMELDKTQEINAAGASSCIWGAEHPRGSEDCGSAIQLSGESEKLRGQTKATQTKSKTGPSVCHVGTSGFYHWQDAAVQTCTAEMTAEHCTPSGGNSTSSILEKDETLSPACLLRKHVRIVHLKVIQVTTDVFYLNGKEVERKVTEEVVRPTVEHSDIVLPSTFSSSTGSSLASGDLADVSSLSKHSSTGNSLPRTSSGTSSGSLGPPSCPPPCHGPWAFGKNRMQRPSREKFQGGLNAARETALDGAVELAVSHPETVALDCGKATRGKGGTVGRGRGRPRGHGRRLSSRQYSKGRRSGKSPSDTETDATTDHVTESESSPLPPSKRRSRTAESSLEGNGQPIEDSSNNVEQESIPQVTSLRDDGINDSPKEGETGDVEVTESPAALAQQQPSSPKSLAESPLQEPSQRKNLVGLRVVAKWSSNDYFYPGSVIRGGADDGRYRVRFDDGYECDVAGRDVLLCDPIPVNTEVTALSEDEYFTPGIVKALQQEEGEVFYCVEKEGQRKWYKRIAVILSVEQGDRLRAQYSLDPLAPPTPHIGIADVSLDNLVEGKRRRRGSPGQCTLSPASKRAARKGSLGKRRLSEQGESSPSKRGCPQAEGPAETSVDQDICRTALPSASTVHVDKVFSSSLVEAFGPLPTSKSLFQGFSMVLTTATPTNASRSPQSYGDESSGLEEDFAPVLFDRAYTEAQIEAGGGVLLNDITEAQAKDPSRCFLVCDRPNHGRSFLLALAAGIPCVSLPWLRDSCRLNERQDFHHYLLPTGYSILSGKLIEWAPRKSPFLDLKVLLVSDNEDFLRMWSDVLMAGKAASTKCYKVSDLSRSVALAAFDLVTTDESCPARLLSCAAALDLPIVYSNWMVQCLVTGHRLGYTDHAAFRVKHRSPSRVQNPNTSQHSS